jgi:vacuolar-type H+-ATPase subunit I/STV1
MWLTGRLMPDFKTIADFRRDNGPAKRDFTPTEIAERKKLRAKLTECREGVAVLAIVTADRLDSSEEVKDLLREMRAVNTGLQKDLAELKKIEKYATIAAQAAEFLNKSVDRLIKLAAAIS